MPRPRRLLLIEDDHEMAEPVLEDLASRGYAVEHAATGPDGLAAARSGGFDLLIVDRLLPDLDGLSVIQALRADGAQTPVLVLSALSAVDERVRGLKAGGDDYLTKPFALMELAARVEALLRRPDRADIVLRVGPLEIDLIARSVRRDGVEIELLPREFKLLEYMARRPGQLLTRDMLLEEVWGYRFMPQSNLVDVHVGKLRRKIEAQEAGQLAVPLITSVRGAGYVLQVANGENGHTGQ